MDKLVVVLVILVLLHITCAQTTPPGAHTFADALASMSSGTTLPAETAAGSNHSLPATTAAPWAVPTNNTYGAGSPTYGSGLPTYGGAPPHHSGSSPGIIYLRQLINSMPRFDIADVPVVLDLLRQRKAQMASLGLVMSPQDMGHILLDFQARKTASLYMPSPGGHQPTGPATHAPPTSGAGGAHEAPMHGSGAHGPHTMNTVHNGRHAPTDMTGTMNGVYDPHAPGSMTGTDPHAGSHASAAGSHGVTGQAGTHATGHVGGQNTGHAGNYATGHGSNYATGHAGSHTTGYAGSQPGKGLAPPSHPGGHTDHSTTSGGTPQSWKSLTAREALLNGKNIVSMPTYNPDVGGILATGGQGTMTSPRVISPARLMQNLQQKLQQQIGASLSSMKAQSAASPYSNLMNSMANRGITSFSNRLNPSMNSLSALMQPQNTNPLAALMRPQNQVNSNPLAALMNPQNQVNTNPLAALMQPQNQVNTNPLAALMQPPNQVNTNPLAALMQPQNQVNTNPLAALMQPQNQVNTNPLAALMKPQNANPLAALMQPRSPVNSNPFAALMQPQNQINSNPFTALMQPQRPAMPQAGTGGLDINSLINSLFSPTLQSNPLQSALTTGVTADPLAGGAGASNLDLMTILGVPNANGQGMNSVMGGGGSYMDQNALTSSFLDSLLGTGGGGRAAAGVNPTGMGLSPGLNGMQSGGLGNSIGGAVQKPPPQTDSMQMMLPAMMVSQLIGKPFALHHLDRTLRRRMILDRCLKAYAQSLGAGEVLRAISSGLDGPWGAVAMAQALNPSPQGTGLTGLMENPVFLMNVMTGGELFSF